MIQNVIGLVALLRFIKYNVKRLCDWRGGQGLISIGYGNFKA